MKLSQLLRMVKTPDDSRGTSSEEGIEGLAPRAFLVHHLLLSDWAGCGRALQRRSYLRRNWLARSTGWRNGCAGGGVAGSRCRRGAHLLRFGATRPFRCTEEQSQEDRHHDDNTDQDTPNEVDSGPRIPRHRGGGRWSPYRLRHPTQWNRCQRRSCRRHSCGHAWRRKTRLGRRWCECRR